MDDFVNQVQAELDEAGYDHALAMATEAEVLAGASCGQMLCVEEE